MVYLTEENFAVYNNEPVKRYTWRTKSGFELSAISFGAVVQKILVPDRNGHVSDIVLGFDELQGYANRNTHTEYIGCVVGRVANRIANGEFDIDGLTYRLAKNFWETHHLHGGNVGFDKVNYHSTVDGNKVIFSRLSKDGEEGYPGDLILNIIYEVKDDDTWYIEYVACTNKKTVVNLTNHSYFNLGGHEKGAEELYNHIININAETMLEATHEWIPTGRIIPVAGTPFDLRVPTRLGDVLANKELAKEVLYHHNLCVSTHGNQGLNFVAHVFHPPSGRYMEVYSDQPGINFYTGNFMPKPSEPPIMGKGGVGYRKHSGLCLETQNYIDAIHHPGFPNSILKPGEVYRQVTKYKFGVMHNKN